MNRDSKTNVSPRRNVAEESGTWRKAKLLRTRSLRRLKARLRKKGGEIDDLQSHLEGYVLDLHAVLEKLEGNPVQELDPDVGESVWGLVCCSWSNDDPVGVSADCSSNTPRKVHFRLAEALGYIRGVAHAMGVYPMDVLDMLVEVRPDLERFVFGDPSMRAGVALGPDGTIVGAK